MEFEDVVVKENPGLCRCCLSEGCYKDLGSEYSWMNETEVYADMLLECFDISISQHMDGPNGPNRLICEVCITRLRDACNFKKQVLESEKKFIDMVARGDFRSKVLYEPVLKAEVIAEAPAEEDEVEYLEDDLDFDDNDDVPLSAAVDAMPGASGQDITVSSLKVPRPKRGRPKKSATSPEKPERKSKVAKIEEKARSSKNVRGVNQETKSETMRRNRITKRNAATILENSTVVPFLWRRDNFLCFFCQQICDDMETLIEHTGKHKRSSVPSAIRRSLKFETVNVEVSAMSCALCETHFDQITELIHHLKWTHKKFFDDDYLNCVIPFKLTSNIFQCVVCNKVFAYFINLNRHMSEHYSNYVCELCGKFFLNHNRLKVHNQICHRSLHCSDCSKTFETHLEWKNHEETVHNRRKVIKCLYCDITFRTYKTRRRHHNLVHDVEMKKHKCPECDKDFQTQSTLERHFRSLHQKERTFPCPLCNKKFFCRPQVKRHARLHDRGGRLSQRQAKQTLASRGNTVKHDDDYQDVSDESSDSII